MEARVHVLARTVVRRQDLVQLLPCTRIQDAAVVLKDVDGELPERITGRRIEASVERNANTAHQALAHEGSLIVVLDALALVDPHPQELVQQARVIVHAKGRQ